MKFTQVLILLVCLLGLWEFSNGASPCVNVEHDYTFRGLCLNTTYRRVLESSRPTTLQGGQCLSTTNAQWVDFKITAFASNITVWPATIVQNGCFKFLIKDDLDQWGNWQERAWGYFYDPTCTVLFFSTPAYWLTLKNSVGQYFGNDNQLCQEYVPGPLFVRGYDPVTSFYNSYFTTEFSVPADPPRPFTINSELVSLTVVWVAEENVTFEATSVLFNNATKHIDSLSTISIVKIAPPVPEPVWPTSFPPMSAHTVKRQPHYEFKAMGKTILIPQGSVPEQYRESISHYLRN
jgi:hypothetical protein